MLDFEAVDHLRAAAAAANLGQLEIVTSEQYDVQLGDMQVHVLDWGGSGEPIVLLHGGGLTAHTWDLVCLGLRPTYRCIAPDLRGHGDSSWSPDQRYQLADHRGDLEGLVAHLGLDRFVLVGMSLGGAVAMHYAGQHAEKLAALVLVDVGPEMSGAGRERLRSFAAESQRLESVDAYVERAMAFNPRRKPELLRRSLLHNLRQDSDGMWAWKYDPRRMGPAGADPDRRTEVVWAAIERIDCPTLVVRGADSDLFLEADAAKLVSRLHHAQFVEIPGAGHTVQGDQPRALTAALHTFLSRGG
jgi:pimeloyl-ACP methyl ester carboxylesterase